MLIYVEGTIGNGVGVAVQGCAEADHPKVGGEDLTYLPQSGVIEA